MAERRSPKTARLTPFGRVILSELGDKLATTSPVLEVDDADLVGGLAYAALRSPLEGVKANVQAYKDVQLEVDAVEAVASFLRAHG